MRIRKHTIRVKRISDCLEAIPVRIAQTQCLRRERMDFSPVRPPGMPRKYGLEFGKQRFVGNDAIERLAQCRADIAARFPEGRAQPCLIRTTEPDIYRCMNR